MAAAAAKPTRNKKRKHSKSSNNRPSWEQEQDDYFQRLLYSAQKSLRKQSKLVRNLELQKMVRKLKEHSNSGREETYQQLKHLSLEHVVQESLRRLGILHLDPKLGRAPKAEEEEDNHNPEESKATAAEPSKVEKELVEKLLKHKKLQSALEEWNEKVTEYRRWSLQQQERETAPKFMDQSSSELRPSKKKKKKKKQKKEEQQLAANNSDGQKSLFVCLGKAEDDDDDSEEEGMPHYGPGSLLAEDERKKNRMGQRQRKAKRLAIEAKKAGRVHRAADSTNWRKKKPTNQEGSQQQSTFNERQSSSSTTEKNKAPASAEKLHPSWAAAQAKKEASGIVQFQGKKITFD